MKFLMILAVLVTTATALTACKTTADTKRDVYSVDLDSDGAGNGKCPPGHHMKGWC